MKINPEDLINQEWNPIIDPKELERRKLFKKKYAVKYYKKHKKQLLARDAINKKKYAANLEDTYIKNLLACEGIKNPHPKLIELKRANVMLRREMRKQKEDKKNLEKNIRKNIPKQFTFEFFDGMKETYAKFLGKK
jgi:hypothetical protein